MFVLCLCIASCSKSNGDLIKEYGEICEEVAEAYKNGDMSKVTSLAEKGQKIETELSKRDLTDEEKAEVAGITLKLAGSISGDVTEQLNAVMGAAAGSWTDSSDNGNADTNSGDNDTDSDDDDLDF